MFQKIFRMVPVISGTLTGNTGIFTQAILSRYMIGQRAESPVPTRSTLPVANGHFLFSLAAMQDSIEVSNYKYKKKDKGEETI